MRCQLRDRLHWVAPVSCLSAIETVKATAKIASRQVSWDWPAASSQMLRLPGGWKSRPNWSEWSSVRPTNAPVSPPRKRHRPPSACRRGPTLCRWPTMEPLQSLQRELWPARSSVTRYFDITLSVPLYLTSVRQSMTYNGRHFRTPRMRRPMKTTIGREIGQD